MRIREIMSTPVHTIRADEPASAAWEAMRLYRTGHLVVAAKDGHAIGVLSAGDLGGRNGENARAGRRVRDMMTEKLVVVEPDTTVREAANLMRGHDINCLPVFDHRHRLKGIVTHLDLLELIGRGTERPVAEAVRRTPKNRGVAPRQSSARTMQRAMR